MDIIPEASLSLITILEKTLNYVDPRLMDHGKRVAHIIYHVLKSQNTYSRKQLRDICILAMLHDIGAYKTEEIDKMVEFETSKVWEHSIYGYLFLKYFSPLKDYSPVILYHHADLEEIQALDPAYHELAQMINLADRLDIGSLAGISDWKKFVIRFEKQIGTNFSKAVTDMFFHGTHALTIDVFNGSYDEDFLKLLHENDFTDEEVTAYLKMIVLSIDFRSPQTVNHTFALMVICRYLGKALGYSPARINAITTAALVHDIGKIGIPTTILESPNRLTETEMDIMKSHVVLSNDILKDNIADDIRLIAVRHHERLDGKGYPDGLSADALSEEQRLMSIADVFSALCGVRSYKNAYPKEKIIAILSDMAQSGGLDADLTKLTISCYEPLLQEINKVSAPLLHIYELIRKEYDELRLQVKKLKGDSKGA